MQAFLCSQEQRVARPDRVLSALIQKVTDRKHDGHLIKCGPGQMTVSARVPSSPQLPGTWEAHLTLDTTLEEKEGWINPEIPGIQTLHPLKNGQAGARPPSTPLLHPHPSHDRK